MLTFGDVFTQDPKDFANLSFGSRSALGCTPQVREETICSASASKDSDVPTVVINNEGAHKQAPNESHSAISTIVTTQGGGSTSEDLHSGVLSPNMQLAVPHNQPSIHDRQNSTAIPDPQQQPRATDYTDPQKDPWFVWYSAEERERQPWIVRQTLMAMGHWSPYIARSVYCVVTPSRPEVVPWMGPHNSWRLFLVSAIAAISPANRDHCMYVQAMVAAICFVHGLMIYATRVFRIPALNPLQGTQSILLGLLACAPFIASADAQAAFGNALMALSLVTVVLSALAILLEWRVRRTQISQ